MENNFRLEYLPLGQDQRIGMLQNTKNDGSKASTGSESDTKCSTDS